MRGRWKRVDKIVSEKEIEKEISQEDFLVFFQ